MHTDLEISLIPPVLESLYQTEYHILQLSLVNLDNGHTVNITILILQSYFILFLLRHVGHIYLTVKNSRCQKTFDKSIFHTYIKIKIIFIIRCYYLCSVNFCPFPYKV